MHAEVSATVRLHLAGMIGQWFFQTDGRGVLFHLNLTDPAETPAMLDRIPLRMASMMEFELIPVGPLRALGFLLTTSDTDMKLAGATNSQGNAT